MGRGGTTPPPGGQPQSVGPAEAVHFTVVAGHTDRDKEARLPLLSTSRANDFQGARYRANSVPPRTTRRRGRGHQKHLAECRWLLWAAIPLHLSPHLFRSRSWTENLRYDPGLVAVTYPARGGLRRIGWEEPDRALPLNHPE